jgi:hypothetical protein
VALVAVRLPTLPDALSPPDFCHSIAHSNRTELLSASPSYSGFIPMPHQRLSDSTATPDHTLQRNPAIRTLLHLPGRSGRNYGDRIFFVINLLYELYNQSFL